MTNKTIRVLLIEDNPGDAKLVRTYLDEPSADQEEAIFEVKMRDRLSQGVDVLRNGGAEVVLLDIGLPDSSGIDSFSLITNVAPQTPIVILSGLQDLQVAADAVRRGAQDFLPKNDLTGPFLKRAIHYAIERKIAQLEILKARKQVEEKAWGLEKTNQGIKALYKELEKKNEKLRSLDQLKSEFVSTVSHELRTPMTIIREGVSQVNDGLLGPLNDEQKQFLGITLEGIDRLGRIINDLLDFSKLEAGKVELEREALNIVDVANSAISLFSKMAEQQGLKLELSAQSEVVEANVDRDKMLQVFTNLIGNAIKFTEQGTIAVGILKVDKAVRCYVQDSGVGIPARDLDRVFGHFEQVGRTPGPGDKGTGLGLAICSRILDLHRGKMKVESQVGVGTKFIFEIPNITPEDLLREYVEAGVQDAIRHETAFSVITLPMRNFDAVKEKLGNKEACLLLHSLGKVLKNSLRRKSDRALATQESLFVFLPDTSKDNALMISGRMRQIVEDRLVRIGLNKIVHISSRVAGVPEDGSDAEEILKKAIG